MIFSQSGKTKRIFLATSVEIGMDPETVGDWVLDIVLGTCIHYYHIGLYSRDGMPRHGSASWPLRLPGGSPVLQHSGCVGHVCFIMEV